MTPAEARATVVVASELGAAAARALAVRRHGRVEHAFHRAAYVSLGAEVVHLAGPGLPLGPLTVRVPAWRPLEPGRRVEVDVVRARVRTWSFPPAVSLLEVAAAVDRARAALSPAGVDPGDLSDLAAAARRLSGVGPGLTPAGDDVLAGLLLALALTGGDAGSAWRTIAPALAATTPIARAYLRAAARGECAEPLARVLDASLRGDGDTAARLAPAVAEWGASTGPALLAGFAAGLSPRAAAAGVARPSSGPGPSPSVTSAPR